MNKWIFFLISILLLIGCQANQTQPSGEVRFSEVNDMKDAEYINFMWYEEASVANGSFTLYNDDERVIELIEEIRHFVVSEDELALHDPGIGITNSLILLVIMHDESNRIYTTVELNDVGEVFIYNRYTDGEVPDFYVSKGHQGFHEKVRAIIDVEKGQERGIESEFEYKSETTIGTSIFEIRSEEGQLIADVSDIEKDSVKVVMNESDQPIVEIRINDKELVYRFTSAHKGEEARIYVNGELVSSPRIMEPIMSNTLAITGNFDKETLEQMVIKIKAE